MEILNIIVPVFNSEKYLKGCLNSIKNQTFKDWICLLIDDDSNDHSPEICKSFSEEDKRFKYYHKNRGGVADTRNFGLDKSTGKYISFVDNDDLLHPEMYECLIYNLEKTDSEVSCCKYMKEFRSPSELKSDFSITMKKEPIEILNNSEEIFYSIVKGSSNNGIEGLI